MKTKEEVITPTYKSIEEAVEKLSLSKIVKWKVWLGYLCRYTKKDICPQFVFKNGMAVQITNH